MLQRAIRRRGSSIQRQAVGARVALIAGAADRLMEVVAEAVGSDHEEHPVLLAVPLMLMHSFAKVAACQKMKQLHLLSDRPFPLRFASQVGSSSRLMNS